MLTFVVLTFVSADIFLGLNSINNETTSYQNFAKQLEKQERSVEVNFFQKSKMGRLLNEKFRKSGIDFILQFDVTTRRIIGLFFLRMIYLFFILKVFWKGKEQ